MGYGSCAQPMLRESVGEAPESEEIFAFISNFIFSWNTLYAVTQSHYQCAQAAFVPKLTHFARIGASHILAFHACSMRLVVHVLCTFGIYDMIWCSMIKYINNNNYNKEGTFYRSLMILVRAHFFFQRLWMTIQRFNAVAIQGTFAMRTPTEDDI